MKLTQCLMLVQLFEAHGCSSTVVVTVSVARFGMSDFSRRPSCEMLNKWMDKWRKKEWSRQTTAIKCPLNDARIRKTIKQQIDSGGQEAPVAK